MCYRSDPAHSYKVVWVQHPHLPINLNTQLFCEGEDEPSPRPCDFSLAFENVVDERDQIAKSFSSSGVLIDEDVLLGFGEFENLAILKSTCSWRGVSGVSFSLLRLFCR